MATNFFGYPAAIGVALSDQFGNAVLVRCTVANIPSAAAGYAIGCLLQATDTGGIYTNTGTAVSSTFTLLEDAGGSFSLPVTATDAATTTGTSMAFTQNAVTSGAGFTQALNGLTTGFGHSITHTTSVIANGGSLLNLSSTGVDTSTTTGVLLNLVNSGSAAGTQILGTFAALTTGIGASLVTNALTTGQTLSLSSSATAITTTGRLLSVNHSGATSTSGTIAEVISAANDETVIFQVTASAANALGVALQVTTATTTGIGAGIIASSLTTGTALRVYSNSADATARSLQLIHNDNAAAVGTIPLTITQDGPTNTNFFKGWVVNGVTFYVGNGTTSPNTVVTGAAGDVAFNCDSGKSYYCTGTTNWTAFA